jgi:uncharacterized Fe-S cluster-containing radical SAM superfamily protein
MSDGSHITERERAEACSVTGQGRGHLFEIQLGHLCNDRCVFCSSGQLTQMKLARAIKLDPIVEAIEAARTSGARRVTFLGGEPTIQKNFPAALKRAVELGFEEIVIFTNGVMLPHPGFIDKIVALGKFEWRISIQGATEEAHVAVTLRKDSFQRIVTGLKMLQERGQLVTSNICVNERSYRSLPAFPALIQEYGVRQLHVDIVRPSSTGERSEEYLREIMPRYSDMAPSMAAMLQGFEDRKVDCDVGLGNLPLCILPKWAHRIHHGGEDTVTQAADASGLEVAVDKYQWHASLRQHVKACDGCVFRPHCTGIFTKYLELYGDSEFQTVTQEQLRELDPERKSFVLHVGPLLHRLERELPAGWIAVTKEVDRRGHQIELRFAHVDAGTVLLKVTPPVAGSHLLTKDFSVQASAENTVPEEALEQLIAWVAARLSIIATNLETFFADHREARLRERGLDRARQLVEKISRHGPFDGYQFVRTREETSALVAELAGTSGQIELVFNLRLKGGKPQVTLDARPVNGTDVATAGRAIRNVVTFLQAPNVAG